MPQVNLSTLSGPELRQMLDSSRRRGEAKLTYQILQEMAARREAQPERGVLRMLRPAEPRVIDIDLGDPMDPKDELPPMPSWRAPSPEPEVAAVEPPVAAASPPRQVRRRKTQPAPTLAAAMAAGVAELDAEPEPTASAEPAPRSVWDADPEPLEDLPRPQAPERRRPSGGLRRGLAAGFVAGAAAGVALGWWFGTGQGAAPAPAAPIQTAALAPPPAPMVAAPTVAPPEPVAETPPALSVELAPPDAGAANAAPPEVEVAAAEPEPVKTVEPPPRIAVARAAPPVSDACAAEPTPADRQICGDEDLRRLQSELREAYAEALDAHVERALLRQRQLAWRSARDTVSDPTRLAQLYEARIRKLHAATAAARQEQ